jgi:hypothetical protein
MKWQTRTTQRISWQTNKGMKWQCWKWHWLPLTCEQKHYQNQTNWPEKIHIEKYVAKIFIYFDDVLWSSRLIDWILVLNATFSNISAISWRPVLVVEEAGVPGENHRPWASNW